MCVSAALLLRFALPTHARSADAERPPTLGRGRRVAGGFQRVRERARRAAARPERHGARAGSSDAIRLLRGEGRGEVAVARAQAGLLGAPGELRVVEPAERLRRGRREDAPARDEPWRRACGSFLHGWWQPDDGSKPPRVLRRERCRRQP